MYVVDDLNRTLHIASVPKRIVSVVPSLSELLMEIGLAHQLIGRTKFCIFPDTIKNVTTVGGTKQLNIEKIKALQPDIIFANKEENIREQIHALESFCPVFVTDIFDTQSAIKAIKNICNICNKKEAGVHLVEEITRAQDSFKAIRKTLGTCIYLIWENPTMSIGNDTYIHALLELCGFQSVIQEQRYPNVDLNSIDPQKLDYILLSSEPFPFREKHVNMYQERFPNSTVLLVDGTYFSWYGSRLKDSFHYFEQRFYRSGVI